MTAAIKAQSLTEGTFALFGDVIDTNRVEARVINNGMTLRYHGLGRIDVQSMAGQPVVSLFRSTPIHLPFRIEKMERHPYGSQMFFPLSDRPYLVVAALDVAGVPGLPVAFLAGGGQGVNYARNTWHHSLLALEAASDFLVVDGDTPGNNLQTHVYCEPLEISA